MNKVQQAKKRAIAAVQEYLEEVEKSEISINQQPSNMLAEAMFQRKKDGKVFLRILHYIKEY